MSKFEYSFSDIEQNNQRPGTIIHQVKTDFHNLLSSIQRMSPACQPPLLATCNVGNMCALFIQCQMIGAVR